MKIYKMTATFGKLEKATLTLSHGLNVIAAPNEWGKSTWCAFLTAMLYGIATNERTTKDALAVKEKYAPWSGLPMEGSMDISWQGRDITIERFLQGRTPFGGFRAYETASGLPVPELTGANCGQLLLGIEKNVFTRTAFLHLADLPVTDDAALRNRLNSLVTTGDESGAEETLTTALKELRNRVRHNKTGLLPQAERQREDILDLLRQLDTIEAGKKTLLSQITQNEKTVAELENHKLHLQYAAAMQEQQHLTNARAETARLKAEIHTLEEQLSALPSEEETRYHLQQLAQFQQKWAELQEKPRPTPPEVPVAPAPFAGLSGQQAAAKAREDLQNLAEAKKPQSPLFLILTLLSFLLGFGLMLVHPIWIATFAAVGSAFLMLNSREKRAQEEKVKTICAAYGDLPPENWLPLAEGYLREESAYRAAAETYEQACTSQKQEEAVLSARLGELTLGKTVSECMDAWNGQLHSRETLAALRQAYTQAEAHEKALAAVVKTVPAPQTEDDLIHSEAVTDDFIARCKRSIREDDYRLQQLNGKASLLGDRETQEAALAAVDGRIARLEQHYTALTIAMEKAQETSQSLQQRFAPAISQEAQRIFASLTGGRYDRFVLSRDFSVQTSANDETTLHETRYRSDGTADQLYIALRLAVAKTLAPEAPLVLDDAFVRFDDTRLAAALALLKEEARSRQVILFTCQSREQTLLDD